MKCIYENAPTFTGEPSCEGKVELRHALTAYHFDGVKNSEEDPNKDFYCCEAHYEEYYQYWKERWDEYYSGLL